jgi:DNA-directed RNA polymerase specialized sigma24 family protein
MITSLDMEGFSYEEIGRRLGRSETAVKKHLSLRRARLRGTASIATGT